MKFRRYLGYRSKPIDRLASADLPPGRRFGATRGRLGIMKYCKAIQALDLIKGIRNLLSVSRIAKHQSTAVAQTTSGPDHDSQKAKLLDKRSKHFGQYEKQSVH